jgi:acrylyl-CoA reductase (NADPH)
MAETFRAWVIDRGDAGQTCTLKRDLTDADLPAGEVLVDVQASTINYKDALAVTGKGKIIRGFPGVPGIDFAGTVVESASDRFEPGDQVVLNGFGVGESHWGGLAERARVPADWLITLPEAFTPMEAMAIGTAGYTAALCVDELERAGVAQGAEVVVTGAAGGVGSIAITLLRGAGFRPVAVTGRESLADYLRELGAVEVLPRTTFTEPAKGPLASARWPGAVDTVGGEVLANLLKTMAYEGTVAACGLAGGIEVPTTVMPFILRGVRLVGVESVYQPLHRREAVWQRLAQLVPSERLAEISRVVAMHEVPAVAEELLAGHVRGRTVVDVKA